MSLTDIVTEQLAVARSIIAEGDGMVPTWRITTSDGAFLILTRFDDAKPEQRDRVLFLLSRFMVWKMATSFAVTAETRLGSEGIESETALLTVAVSHREQLAAIQRLQKRDTAMDFGPIEWLGADQVDEGYWRLLPAGRVALTTEEVAELSAIFGKDGELSAQRLG